MAKETKISKDTLIGYSPSGQPLYPPIIKQLFDGITSDPKRNQSNEQTALALALLQRFPQYPPEQIISLMSDPLAIDNIKIFCLGKGIELEANGQPDPQTIIRSVNLLGKDQELIQKLSPHLDQRNLARLLAVRRFRTADARTLNTLVAGVYRTLGVVLGPRRHYKREAPKPLGITLPDLPDEIFEDEFINNILLESEMEVVRPLFYRSLDECMRYLEELRQVSNHPLKDKFVRDLTKHFTEAEKLQVEGFVKQIYGSHKDLPEEEDRILSEFPSRHQKEYAHRILHKKIGSYDLLHGATATQKTGMAIYAAKAAGCKASWIVCPAGNRDQWEREIIEKFETAPKILKIESLDDLESARDSLDDRPNFTIISYSLLSFLNNNAGRKLLGECQEKFRFDSLISDEVHLAKEAEAESTQTLYELSKLLPISALRIGMSATLCINSVDDLDAPVRILLPYKYQHPGDFTRAARNDPDLVSALLYGNGLITRCTAEAVFGDRLPRVTEIDKPVPFTRFHLALYEFVHSDDTVEDSHKRDLLRQVSLDPFIMKNHYHPRAIRSKISQLRQKLEQERDEKKQRILQARIGALEERLVKVLALSSLEEAKQKIEEAYQKYLKWRATVNPEEKFDEDFLIKLGYEKDAIWAHIYLKGGLDELITRIGKDVKRCWQGDPEGIVSSKYKQLREDLKPLVESGRYKIIIFSGRFQSDVTQSFEDNDKDGEIMFQTLYDHLGRWFGKGKFLRIDGTVSLEPKKGELAEREKARRRFRLDPDVDLLCSLRASRLGIDLTIPKTRANSRIIKAIQIYIDLPDTAADIEQGEGRQKRQGQEIPIDAIFYKSTHPDFPTILRYGFIDNSIWEAIEFKALLDQKLLDAVPLTEEEERRLRRYLTNIHADDSLNPREYLVRVFFNRIKSAGFTANQRFYDEIGFEGMTNGEFFATYYSLLDPAGSNARAMAYLIEGYEKSRGRRLGRIGSIGAGNAVLQTHLHRSVVNLDMLEPILKVGRDYETVSGSYIGGNAAYLPFGDETFPITEVSNVFHWSDNRRVYKDPYNHSYPTTERMKYLAELNRVTQFLTLVSIPDTFLTEVQFLRWQDTLEKYFGFKVSKAIPSGLLRGIDFKAETIGWVFNLEKMRNIDWTQIQADLEPIQRSLDFAYEDPVKIIDRTNVRPSQEKDFPYPYIPMLPHREFEITSPSGVVRFAYNPTISLGQLRNEILSAARVSLRGILPMKAAEEFDNEGIAHYHWLVKEGEKAGMSRLDAQQKAFNAVNFWLHYGQETHNLYRIREELFINFFNN